METREAPVAGPWRRVRKRRLPPLPEAAKGTLTRKGPTGRRAEPAATPPRQRLLRSRSAGPPPRVVLWRVGDPLYSSAQPRSPPLQAGAKEVSAAKRAVALAEAEHAGLCALVSSVLAASSAARLQSAYARPLRIPSPPMPEVTPPPEGLCPEDFRQHSTAGSDLFPLAVLATPQCHPAVGQPPPTPVHRRSRGAGAGVALLLALRAERRTSTRGLAVLELAAAGRWQQRRSTTGTVGTVAVGTSSAGTTTAPASASPVRSIVPERPAAPRTAASPQTRCGSAPSSSPPPSPPMSGMALPGRCSPLTRSPPALSLGGRSPGTPPLSPVSEAEERAAAAARAADRACGNQQLVSAVRYAILAQAAYRVPTASDFWERVRAIEEGRSRACVWEVLRKCSGEAVHAHRRVKEVLQRLFLCSGRQFNMIGCTQLDLGAADALHAVAELSSAQGRLHLGVVEGGAVLNGGRMRPLALQAAKVRGPPAVPPGWLLCVEEGSPADVTVCISGTQTLDDVFRDCMFVPVPISFPPDTTEGGSPKGHSFVPPPEWAKLKVHEGFLDGAHKVWRPLLREVLAYREASSLDSISLHFTGHSLGGATCVLLAAFFEAAELPGVKVSSVWTYGAPNVFHIDDWDETVPVLREVQMNQYVNNSDVVPRGLGSSLVRKLAKLFIRLGMQALSAVTAENADCLPGYRFTSSALLLIRPQGEVAPITDRAEQRAALSLGVGGILPQALRDHKLGAGYIRRLLTQLDGATCFQHCYDAEGTAAQSAAAEVTAAAPFAASIFDGSALREGFSVAMMDIYVRMRCPEGSDGVAGGLDSEGLAWIFHWSDRLYPRQMIEGRALRGAYELHCTGQLSASGWSAFVEDACYTDILWAGRLLAAFGFSDNFRKGRGSNAERTRAHCGCSAPYFDPAGASCSLLGGNGELSAPAAAAVSRLFAHYAEGDLSLPPAALRAFIANVLRADAQGFPFGDVAAEIGAAAGSAADGLCEALAHTGDASLLRVLCGASAGDSVRQWVEVTEAGLQTAVADWCHDDEPRVWRLLVRGAAFSPDLHPPDKPNGILWEYAGDPNSAAALWCTLALTAAHAAVVAARRRALRAGAAAAGAVVGVLALCAFTATATLLRYATASAAISAAAATAAAGGEEERAAAAEAARGNPPPPHLLLPLLERLQCVALDCVEAAEAWRRVLAAPVPLRLHGADVLRGVAERAAVVRRLLPPRARRSGPRGPLLGAELRALRRAAAFPPGDGAPPAAAVAWAERYVVVEPAVRDMLDAAVLAAASPPRHRASDTCSPRSSPSPRPPVSPSSAGGGVEPATALALAELLRCAALRPPPARRLGRWKAVWRVAAAAAHTRRAATLRLWRLCTRLRRRKRRHHHTAAAEVLLAETHARHRSQRMRTLQRAAQRRRWLRHAAGMAERLQLCHERLLAAKGWDALAARRAAATSPPPPKRPTAADHC
eukprot:TRINITY_DN19988_c0_g1_i1.p1 TRINITY_DN19988_c0_g1~~TRINITY_DN19988_c0_g1_i1.p1  ORF type:complete len:1458 (+),score=220.22 TRINITY_DN19988_c0_g1_i1:102-4475(+)